jgi:hypothetical protein
MTTQKITITTTSGGYIGGNKAQISVDSQEIGFASYRRGLNVAVFDETTGLPRFSTTFDTAIGNSDIFADFINRLPPGRIVAIAVQGDSGNLTDRAKAACKSLGSTQIDSLQAYQSYTLIGIKDQGAGAANESINWSESNSSYSFNVETVQPRATFVIEALCKPSTLGADCIPQGGEAQIRLNGNTLAPEGGYQSGWNVLVLDAQNGQLKRSGSFHPWNPQAVEELIQLLQNVEAGEIVAIATQNYAGVQVDESLKQACASIGSRMIAQLTYGGSWAMVGYPGAEPGEAVENLDNISPYCGPYGAEELNAKYWVSVRQKQTGLARIIVSGDVDIIPPVTGSVGKTINKDNVKFFTRILGDGERVVVQQTANFGSNATINNMGIPLNDFYNGLPGVSSSFLKTPLEPDSLTGVNLFICIAPQRPLPPHELLQMGRLLEEGGTVFFVGNGGWGLGLSVNSNINSALAALGSTIRMLNNLLYGTLEIANTPLTKELLSFTYITPSEVELGDGMALFSVGKRPFVVAKMR